VCDAAALGKNRKAMELFPDFPFTYFAMAYCLQKQGNSQWRSYAERAAVIFEQTIAIGGHQQNYDECLAYVRQLLATGKIETELATKQPCEAWNSADIPST
jgi:hypothetical protein